MSKVLDLADQFLKIVEAKNKSDKSDLSGRMNRKMLLKKLEEAKVAHSKGKAALNENVQARNKLDEVIQHQTKAVEKARKDVMSCYDVLKNMDLVDSNEVRFMPDEVCYVMNSRLFVLRKNKETGEQELIPYRKAKSSDAEDKDSEKEEAEEDAEEKEEDKSDADDDSDGEADDLYNLLVNFKGE